MAQDLARGGEKCKTALLPQPSHAAVLQWYDSLACFPSSSPIHPYFDLVAELRRRPPDLSTTREHKMLCSQRLRTLRPCLRARERLAW